MWHFKSTINSKDIDLAIAGMSHPALSNIEIKWTIEPEIREWGVKGLIVHIPDQTISLLYETENHLGDSVEVETEIEMQDIQWEYKPGEGDFQMTPQSIMIDTERRKFSVEF